MLRVAALIFALVAACGAEARAYSPRIVSPHNADAYSMKTFAQFHRWRHLKGDQRAWEVYAYLADRRTGLFHMNEVLEGDDVLSEYSTIRDPVKIINVYGYAYCGILGPVMAGVCEGIGIGPSRTLVLPAWNHVAAETFYENAWHYLDIDVRAAFRRADGSLASMADARRDPSLWKGPRGPLFFPHDPLEKTADVYAKTAVHHYHGFNSSGHTMDFILRQGETLTRWWEPQGGRWHHSESYNRQTWLRRLLEEEPRGPKPNHRDFSIHNYGNGRFVYEPNLTDRSSDFTDGVYDAENVRPAANGLTLISRGDGYAVFEVRTPYIIVPVVGDLETTDDDYGASAVWMDAVGASVAISLNGGISWKKLEYASCPGTLDLTPHVSGTYGYLLKIVLQGRPGEVLLRSLRITTWVQVAPASLPSLRPGKNRMAYREGDHYGLKSRVLEIRPNGSDPEDFLKYVCQVPKDYDPGRRTSRVRGEFVVKVQSPPDTRIAWLSIGGSFQTHQRSAARNTSNMMAYAVEAPRDFKVFYRANVPSDNDHWHYNADREVKFDTPARVIYIRYTGNPAVNNIRIYAHCVEDHPRAGTPVNIKHVWAEGGVRKTRAFTLHGPDSYDIFAAGEVVNKSIEISIPSDSPP